MVATIDQTVYQRLNEHDAKLARLEAFRDADKATRDDFYASLREDVSELKGDLKPIIGLGILSQPQATEALKEQAKKQTDAFVSLLRAIGIAVIVFVIIIGFAVLVLIFRSFAGA